MWTCSNCEARADEPPTVCRHCGAVVIRADDADEASALEPTPIEDEPPTEYEVRALPEAGPTPVEFFIGVAAREVAVIADRLKERGITAVTDEVPDDDGRPAHRIGVPLAELERALALIDEIRRRRAKRP